MPKQQPNDILIYSIKHNNLELFNKSIKLQANPHEAIDEEGNSAFALALLNKNWDLANSLLNMNIAVDVKDSKGRSALALSSESPELHAKIKNTISYLTNVENKVNQQISLLQQKTVSEIIQQNAIQAARKIFADHQVAALMNNNSWSDTLKNSIKQLINSLLGIEIKETETVVNSLDESESSLEKQKEQDCLNEVVTDLQTQYLAQIENSTDKIKFLENLLQEINEICSNQNQYDETVDYDDDVPVFRFEKTI